MKTDESCSTCNHKEKSRSNYPCRSCVYNEFAPNATLHYWELRKDTIKMKDFTQKEAEKYEQSLDKLYKPLNYDKHYANTAHQPIEVMQANMTRDEFVGFLKGNIIKYVCRLGKKDEPAKEAAKIRRYAEWLEQAVSGQTVDPRK